MRALTQSVKHLLVLMILCFGLMFFWFLILPERDSVVVGKSLYGLSSQEQRNIAVACAKLNGVTILPGQVFSFNRVTAPLATSAGYVNARILEGKANGIGLGGGICLLSSAIYELTQRTQLQVLERWSHTKSTHSVRRGLDAAVWQGSKGLRWKNNYPQGIELSCSIRNFGTLELSFIKVGKF